MGLAAHSNNFGFGIGNSARFIFLPADTVDHMTFGVPHSRFGDGANDVDLVIFPR